MRPDSLNEKSVDEVLIKITDGIKHRDPEDRLELLDKIAKTFDDLDNYDFFGTEGWLHEP